MVAIEGKSAGVAATVAATDAAPVQRIEIVGERRRAHDAAFRGQVLAEAMAPGTRIRDLARRYGICASLIYRWRRDASPQVGAASGVQLVPVRVSEGRIPRKPAAAPRSSSEASKCRTIEIELDGGIRVRVGDNVSLSALRRVVAALRG